MTEHLTEEDFVLLRILGHTCEMEKAIGRPVAGGMEWECQICKGITFVPITTRWQRVKATLKRILA